MKNIFVINLKESTDRWEKFKGKNVIRWEATNIDDISYDLDLQEKMISYWNVRYTKFHFTKCACFMSHLKLWKHIIDNKINDILILEDDAVGDLDIDTSYFKQDGITYLGGFFLDSKHFDIKIKTIFETGYHKLDETKYRLIQCMSYYFPTWKIAEKLYNEIINCKRYRAIDMLITKIDIPKYFVYPAVFTEERVESTINNKGIKKGYSNQYYHYVK
jgi:GR25 family glycosyltransferase involved in LPS biosynthesis